MNSTLITNETILLNLDASSKTDALHQICAHLFLKKRTQDPSHLFEDIVKREEIVSTFAGSQTAIPHTISEFVTEPVLSFARVNNEDFTWNGKDENVRFIFLLAAPKQDDLKRLRQSQSYVFSSIAQLISHHETLNLWAQATEQHIILDSLNQAFRAYKTTKAV